MNSLRAGSVVAGCLLVTEVGVGGSATVWLATDRDSGDRVAVKVLDGPLPPLGRLRLRHPHLVQVLRTANDPPAVVMELAEGGSLAALVAARGPLDPGEVVTLVVALGGALADLHRAGVVHGDVSGGNVLFAVNARPVLGDLATVRVAGAGPRVATAGYAAPEVMAGLPPGPAADVHGLCCAAWLALAGAPPGPAASRAPLPVLAATAPGDLVALISRGVDPDSSRRPSPTELVEVAAQSCAATPIRLVAGAMPVLAAPEAVTHRLREWSAEPDPAATGPDRSRRWWRRREVPVVAPPWRTVVGVVGAGVVLGVLVAGSGLALRAFDAPAAGAPALETVNGPTVTGPTVTGPDITGPDVDRLRAVVVGLVDSREAALRAGDVAALDKVYVTNSSAGAADRDLIERHGALDVELSVDVIDQVHAAGGGVAPDGVATATVSARVAALTSGADDESTRAAEQVVRIDLVSTPAGWRIAAVG